MACVGAHQKMPLTVIHVSDPEAARAKLEASGGTIVHETYGFPGGRRFHFADPADNELAEWSEAAPYDVCLMRLAPGA